jgi:hypothetical protein
MRSVAAVFDQAARPLVGGAAWRRQAQKTLSYCKLSGDNAHEQATVAAAEAGRKDLTR